MNLANICHLLKPDSQIISRLCEAAQDCWGAAFHKEGWRGHLPRAPCIAALSPPPVLFIADSLIVRDRRSKHKILLSSLLGPLSKFLSPLASRPGSQVLTDPSSLQATFLHISGSGLHSACFTQQASPLEGEWGSEARSWPSHFTEFGK